mgnify:CR=1 FL=1
MKNQEPNFLTLAAPALQDWGLMLLVNRLNKWQDAVKAELENQRQAALFKASEPKVGSCKRNIVFGIYFPFCYFYTWHIIPYILYCQVWKQKI